MTCNMWEYTKQMLDSINKTEGGFDVVLIDDHSTDGTIENAKKMNIKVLTKPIGRGCTDSMNMAYQYFKFSDYDNLFIANNDCLIPKGAMSELIKNVEDGCLTVPVSTLYGSGENKVCSLNTYHNIPESEHYQKIQDAILNSNIKPIKAQVDWAAFLFGMNKSTVLKERYGNLFSPYNINIHQEREMKFKFMIKIVPTAFVYHYKAMTLKETDNTRNDLSKYHENYFRPKDGELVIKWRRKGNDYMIDNVFAYPFSLLHIMMLLSNIVYVSSQKLLEDMYDESSNCNIDV